MSSLPKFTINVPSLLSLIMIISFAPTTLSQQSYDNSNCTSISLPPGSKYVCSSDDLVCDAFIAYRARTNFNTVSAISPLFGSSQADILSLNSHIDGDSMSIEHGREVIIPVTCQCLGGFSRAIVRYNLSSKESFDDVACRVFEGLVKANSLSEENPGFKGHEPFDDRLINVSIKCACPEVDQRSKGVNHLVTYPIVENDIIPLIARKFSVSEEMVMDANRLGPHGTIFPETTILVPTQDVPTVNWSIGTPSTSPPGPRAVTPLRKIVGSTESSGWHSHVFLGAGALMSVLVVGWAILCIKKVYPTGRQPFSTGSLPLWEASPNFLDGLSKLKQSLLVRYSLEELRLATDDFNESSMISTGVYMGRLGGSSVAIKQVDSEEAACLVIYILTKINHCNIVKLQGWCHEKNPFLVYELAQNGSLRDCLSNAELGKQLTWARRKQIALDIAVALHYLHYCTKPAFVHRNVNSRNVLITADWRAKICGFRQAKQLADPHEVKKDMNWNESVIVGLEGNLSPEYLNMGQTSLTLDVYAFGIVVLELLSGKEVVADGKVIQDSINFQFNAGPEGSSDCLEKLKEFMDAVLQEEYPLGEATLLVLLGKACTAEDSHSRPTMSNIVKTLSRIV